MTVGIQIGERPPAYMHRARGGGSRSAPALDRQPSRGGRPRTGPDCNMLGELLSTEAASLWRDRWGAWYGELNWPLVGAATSKTLVERIGLMAVVIAICLGSMAPEGADWDVSLKAESDGSPRALIMIRDDTRHVVKVRLERRSLVVGPVSIPLASTKATASALRAMAAETGAFFGAPTRAVEAH